MGGKNDLIGVICVVITIFQQTTGMGVNTACGQLNWENLIFPVPARA